MKTMYIPKGETVSYDTLETERLVVNGCLKVDHSLKARTISGAGVVIAGTVSADDIRLRELEAASVYCLRLAAKRVQAAEVFASESAAVSCYLCADYVASDRVTVALHDVGKVDAREVAVLTQKKRSLFRLLLASALRSVWLSLTAPRPGQVMDAEYCQVKRTEEPEASVEASSEGASEQLALPTKETTDTDFELNRIVSLFKLSREQGYTLRLIPGTPEENAPRFDFDTERIEFPAA